MSNTRPDPFQLLAKRNLKICGVEITVIKGRTHSDIGVNLPDKFRGTEGLAYEFSLLGACVDNKYSTKNVGDCLRLLDKKTFVCEVEITYKKKKTTKYKMCFHAVNKDDEDNDPSEDVIDMD